jgi:hypothetical protein
MPDFALEAQKVNYGLAKRYLPHLVLSANGTTKGRDSSRFESNCRVGGIPKPIIIPQECA